jgi:galactokinase
VHSDPEAGGRLAAIIREGSSQTFTATDLERRLQHFLLENETLVPAASRALAAGDIESFGQIADASQRGAEDLLQNQVSETVSLARMARELGAAAASAFGAGFGGSVWALVKQSDAPSFSERWQAQYRTVASRSVLARGSFFVTAAGPPATTL